MPNIADSLKALRALALQGQPETDDPRIRGYADRSDRIDEMRRNLAKVGPGFTTGATPVDVEIAQEDQLGDPDLGTVAQGRARAQQQIYDAGVAYEQPQAKKMRDEALATTLAPAQLAGANAVGLQEAKNRGALDLLKREQEGQSALVQLFGRGGEGTDGTGASNPNVKMTINASGDPTFAQIPITNQTRQMGETAKDILDLIDRTGYEQQAVDLKEKGLFQPGIGIARRYLAQKGLGTIAGVDDNTASSMGQFETTHDLLLSAIARAHAGARGAGNMGMAARFDKLLGSQGDLPTFVGQLRGMRSLLETYAKHVDPNQTLTPTFSAGAGAGAADDDLGVGF